MRSPDSGDDYLIALAAANQAVIVSGDRHLFGLGEGVPVYTPAAFLSLIEGHDPSSPPRYPYLGNRA